MQIEPRLQLCASSLYKNSWQQCISTNQLHAHALTNKNLKWKCLFNGVDSISNCWCISTATEVWLFNVFPVALCTSGAVVVSWFLVETHENPGRDKKHWIPTDCIMTVLTGYRLLLCTKTLTITSAIPCTWANEPLHSWLQDPVFR